MKIIRALALVSAFATAAFAQNAVTLPWAEQQFFNSAGQPLSGGYIYTCTAGSSCGISTPGQPPSTPLATYTNSTGTVQNTNPVVLDSGGRASIWIGTSTAYKIIATTSAGVTQWTQDNVVAYATSAQLTSLSSSLTAFESSLASSTGSTLVGYEASGTGSVARTVASKLGDTVNVKDFGATGNGTTDDTAAITAALATISGGGYVRVPAGTYKLSGSQAVTVGGYTAGGGLLCDNGATFTTASTSASLFNVTSNGRVSGCSVTLPTGYTGSVFTVNSGQNGSAGDIGMEIDHITINGNSSDASGNALQVISTATQNVSFLYAHEISVEHLGTAILLNASGSGSGAYINGNIFTNWTVVGGNVTVDFNAGSGSIIQGNVFANWVVENPATAFWQYDGTGNIWQNISENTMLFDVSTPDKTNNTTSGAVQQNMIAGFTAPAGSSWTPNTNNTYIEDNQSLLPYTVGTFMASFGQGVLLNGRGGLGIGNVANSSLNTFPYPFNGLNYDPSNGMTFYGYSPQTYNAWNFYDSYNKANVATISQTNGSYTTTNGTVQAKVLSAANTLNVGGGDNVSVIHLVTTFGLTPSAVSSNSCSDQTFSPGGQVANLTASDNLGNIKPPSALGNLSVSGYVASSGVLTLHFCNSSGSPVTPPSGSYSFLAMR